MSNIRYHKATDEIEVGGVKTKVTVDSESSTYIVFNMKLGSFNEALAKAHISEEEIDVVSSAGVQPAKILSVKNYQASADEMYSQFEIQPIKKVVLQAK